MGKEFWFVKSLEDFWRCFGIGLGCGTRSLLVDSRSSTGSMKQGRRGAADKGVPVFVVSRDEIGDFVAGNGVDETRVAVWI